MKEAFRCCQVDMDESHNFANDQLEISGKNIQQD